MDEHTRESPHGSDVDARRSVEGDAWNPPAGNGGTEHPLPPETPPAGLGGLGRWLVVLLVLGGGGLLWGDVEMAALVALAGLVAVAQAADFDPRWRILHLTLAWTVPVGGAFLFFSMGAIVYTSTWSDPMRPLALAAAALGAVLSLLTLAPPFTRLLSGLLFRDGPSNHTTRLSTRLVVQGFALGLAGALAADVLLKPLLEDPQPLFQRLSAVGQTVGAVVLGLAGVGYMIRRDFGQTLARLGLTRVTPGHVAVITIGVIALIGLNTGADLVQHALLPDLWARDQRINEALAGGLTAPRAMLVGLMAGAGEEILLRGALQPKLGLVLTSMLFAALHVQYSWYGMAVILAFGLILGVIRQRTSTSVAVAVHALYDIIVLMAVS